MTTESPILSIQHRNNVVITSFLKEHIMSDEDITRITRSMDNILHQEQVRNLVLDFEKVMSVCSSFLGFLIHLKKRLDKAEGRLVICGLEKKVKNAPNDKFIYELFKIVKLDNFFEISPCVEDAMEHIFSGNFSK
jgi:anti-sigma B factor antagonist